MITKDSKLYIIGETAYHHEGDIDYLYKMVDDIAEIGLNAVKFHLLLNPNSYMQCHHPLIQKIKVWTFSRKQWDEIIEYSNKKHLDVIALCNDVESLEHINKDGLQVSAVEIHSSGLNDYFLLKEAVKFHGTVILGVGGSTMEEIEYACNLLKENSKCDIFLMYGFQSYPTNYADINLAKMLKIKDLFELPVGYTDHTAYDDPNNEIISCMAAMMGINVLEKHYTPDLGKERIDFHSAVGKAQMLRIKELMNLVLTIRGDGSLRMSEPELKYGNTGPIKKAVVAKTNIKKGEKLSLDNLWFKRTQEESSLKQNMFLHLIGLETTRDIKNDEIIDFSKAKYDFKKRRTSDFTHIGKKESN
jgi:sialic acid synthase SpsE